MPPFEDIFVALFIIPVENEFFMLELNINNQLQQMNNSFRAGTVEILKVDIYAGEIGRRLDIFIYPGFHRFEKIHNIFVN